MSVIINHEKAKSILQSAIIEVTQKSWTPSSAYSNEISEVILGSHLTYRYILTNGLLAKATNDNCNPLALQAKSNLTGAFDARSLCHAVLVPMEREFLDERLGGSNEPFLNKPARFPELSVDNAVRRGKDTQLLNAAMHILSNINSSEIALTALKDCIFWIFKRPSRNVLDYIPSNSEGYQQASLHTFVHKFIEKSHEGETCTLIAGTSFNLLSLISGKNYKIQVHKTNQAGSSSKEVSDIDVYDDETLLYTSEVKDKPFSREDVEHAVKKVKQAGHRSLIFLKGPNAKLEGSTEAVLYKAYIKKHFNLYFIDLIDFFNSLLALTPELKKECFLTWINDHAKSARVKDETFKHLVQCTEYLD